MSRKQTFDPDSTAETPEATSTPASSRAIPSGRTLNSGPSPLGAGGAAPQGASSARTIPQGASRTMPSQPLSDTRLAEQDIENRSGNYLFTFGKIGSGKTTFQFHLLRWLLIGGNFKTDVLPIERSRLSEGIVNEWHRMWVSGDFPEGTQRDNPKEFRFRINPHRGVKRPLEMFFFEVSGEDLSTVEARLGNPEPKIDDTLHRFLNNERIRFSLVLVCDGDEPANDDIFIANFLSQLQADYGTRFPSSAPIKLIITKSDLAIKRLQQDAPTLQPSSRRLETEAFVERYLPRTMQEIQQWPAGHAIYQFTVGDVRSEGGKPKISRVSYDDIEVIFEDIYFDFTSKRLGRTFWQKVVAFFRALTE